MPSITGRSVVVLSVRDVTSSAGWYRELLGMAEQSRSVDADGHVGQICLVEPATGLMLCLVDHVGAPDEQFNETHVGLDHLEFLVPTAADLARWADRLDELGIGHSGVKHPPYTANRMIIFRDPDNVQLEFFWTAPKNDG